MSDLLGIGGDPAAAESAFGKFRDSTGYNFQLNEGQRAITSSNAAKGMLNSGATLKALAKYGQGIGGNAFQQYITNLNSVASSGLAAGSAIGGSGSQAGATGASAIANGYGNAASTQGSMYGNAFGAAADLFRGL